MAILTREDSTNISLLLARPETEVRKWDTLVLENDLKNALVPFISAFSELEMSSRGSVAREGPEWAQHRGL